MIGGIKHSWRGCDEVLHVYSTFMMILNKINICSPRVLISLAYCGASGEGGVMRILVFICYWTLVMERLSKFGVYYVSTMTYNQIEN
jgi:hypothetical protein